jgi:hypothetical protein
MVKHCLKPFKKLLKKHISHLDLEHLAAIFMLMISGLEVVIIASQLHKF